MFDDEANIQYDESHELCCPISASGKFWPLHELGGAGDQAQMDTLQGKIR